MENDDKVRNNELIASIYIRCYGELKHYFMSYTHDVMAAEDMLQDLFVKLMNLDVIAGETVGRLVFVMAKRMIIDDARHKAYVRWAERQLCHSVSQFDTCSVAERVEADELQAFERRILRHMAPKRAQVYEMYRHEDLSTGEIADKLKLSRRTVEAHIYLSTKEMKNRLRKII